MERRTDLSIDTDVVELSGQEALNQIEGLVELFHLRNVTTVIDDLDLCVLDLFAELFGVNDRNQCVVLAPDDQGRGVDAVQTFA